MTIPNRFRRFLDRLRSDRAPQPATIQAPPSPPGRLAPAEFVPPGHFYSPIPSTNDIDRVEERTAAIDVVPGVDLRESEQLALLEQLSGYYAAMPFTETGGPGFRYRFENPSYSYADGTFLYSILRHFKPRRLIEVGSGYTSALTLDTNEHFLENRLACTFIEPYPELLLSLLTEDDKRRCRIVPTPFQAVDLAIFDTLESGDVLLIDSTHVSKANSDVNRLFFEVLPRLPAGILVHIHDVFPGFEYPVDWLRAGRAWNEQYLLHAFLQFNSAFRIRLFGSHMVQRHPDWFRTRMPFCLRNPGGAFWMEKVA
jgi:hypothetical protein